MPEPDVSVIIPARNEEELIGNALRSVADQHWVPARLEVIVVENGSSDRTDLVVTDVAAALAPATIRLVRLPSPGVAAAKNAGAAVAAGRILVFMDADSRMSVGLLDAVIRHVAAGERSASIRITADSDDLIDRGFFGLLEFGKRLFRIRANMFACERALFTELGGFDEELNHAEDVEFLRRAASTGVRIGHIHEAWIATSPRRLRQGRWRSGTLRVFGRWALGHVGIGRRWPY